MEMKLKIQTKILNRETNLGVVSMYTVAEVKGPDEVNYSNISRLWQQLTRQFSRIIIFYILKAVEIFKALC